MTKADLHWQLLRVVGALFAMILVLAVAKFTAPPQFYELLKDVAPLAVGMLVAYFAQTLQQRASFVASLRTVWSNLIEAKTQLLRYTQDPAPTWEKFQDRYDTLSRAIDEVPSVYKNIGENARYVGRYPYEPMHDMRKALLALGYQHPDEDRRTSTLQRVEEAWKAMRPKFLAELGAPETIRPDLVGEC